MSQIITVQSIEKRYRQIQSDLQPILMQIQMGETIGDRLQGIDAEVFKVRIRNSDVNRGKSGGYRVISPNKLPEYVVLLDIYLKSDRDDIEISTIQNIIAEFDSPGERLLVQSGVEVRQRQIDDELD